MTMKADSDEHAGPFDLVLTRTVDAPPSLVWAAWTKPEHLKQWWAPKPFTTPECEMDVRPGGVLRTLMRGPDGTEYPTMGIFLELVENERLVFTDTLHPGYRPASEPFFSAIITLEALEGGRTRYTARAIHKDQADREKHERMGFHEGWGTAADQLAALVVRLKESA
jgi:uncharacterized protein YndB with AHSA1/START domain